jgi:hypothetical protein
MGEKKKWATTIFLKIPTQFTFVNRVGQILKTVRLCILFTQTEQFKLYQLKFKN